MNTATINETVTTPTVIYPLIREIAVEPIKEIFFDKDKLNYPKSINKYNASKGTFISWCAKFESDKLKAKGDTHIILQSDEHYMQMSVTLWSKVWYIVLQ